MDQWIAFFVGTPRRFLATVVCVFLIAFMVYPPILASVVNNFVVAISPLLGPLMTLFVIYVGFRIIFRGLLGGGGGNDRHRRR